MAAEFNIEDVTLVRWYLIFWIKLNKQDISSPKLKK